MAPIFGRLSASILFLNVDGGIMFKIFVGRDEKRDLKAEGTEAGKDPQVVAEPVERVDHLLGGERLHLLLGGQPLDALQPVHDHEPVDNG